MITIEDKSSLQTAQSIERVKPNGQKDEQLKTIDYYIKKDRDRIDKVVKNVKSISELKTKNRERLKQLNQVLAK